MFFYSVVGQNEVANRTVNVRTRDNKVHGEFTLEAVLDKFQELAEQEVEQETNDKVLKDKIGQPIDRFKII